MCMSCGCGNPEKRTLPHSITLSDLRACADDTGESIEETIFTILDTYQDYPEMMQSDDDDNLPKYEK